MADQMERKGISIDLEKLKEELKTEIVLISARKNIGIDQLKNEIKNFKNWSTEPMANISNKIDADFFKDLEANFPNNTLYKSWFVHFIVF